MISNLSTTLFVKDSEKYTSWLNTWLEGEVIMKRTNDDGRVFFVYQKDDIRFSIASVKEDTNTPEKVGGSTSTIGFLMDSEAEVEALYKKAVESGMRSRKPGEASGIGGGLAILSDPEKQWWRFTLGEIVVHYLEVQDPEKQWWHFAYFPPQ